MKRLLASGPASISRRLAGFSIIFVTAAMIVASIILYFIVAAVVREQIDQRLDTQIEGLRSALAADAKGMITLTSSLDGPPFDRQGSGWYWQVSGDTVHITSRSLAGADIDSPPQPFDWRRTLSGEPQSGDAANVHGKRLHLRIAEAPVGNKVLKITVTAPFTALSAPARLALLWLIPAMALLGVSLVGGIFLQVRYGLRPLGQLTSGISSISAGTLTRLPEVDVDELRPVSREINRLVDQSHQRLADTRLHFANLAHGLKTPVSSLSLALNSDKDPNGEMRNLVDKIDQRIRHHLARARKTMAEGSSAVAFVAPSVDDLVMIMSRIHVERAITAVSSIDPGLSVICPPEDLDEILGNLIDNAFKWANSSIKISAEAIGPDVSIVIQDDGPGVPDNAILNAFLPGTRMDETVQGDGFGLTIAKELAELYGGTIALRNNHDGGLVCCLKLPRFIGQSTGKVPTA